LLTQIGECSEEAVWGAPFTHFGSYRMCEKEKDRISGTFSEGGREVLQKLPQNVRE